MNLITSPSEAYFYTYAYAFWDNIFTVDDCNSIIEDHDKLQFTNGLIGDNYNDSSSRKSKIHFNFLNNNNEWIFQKLLHVTDLLNTKFYQYDLVGFESYQYTVYHEHDHFDWHLDMGLGNRITSPPSSLIPRKLSFVLFLSDKDDYTGGEFLLNIGDTPIELEIVKGRVYAFPSFIMHKISPILTGNRKSLVWWAVGPKFK
jgi:PKHD-type hydroxylase